MVATMRRAAALIVLAAGLASLTGPAHALDLSVEALFGNMNLDWAGDAPLTAAEYPANLWLYGARVGVTERLGPGFVLDVGYETDPIIRHIVRSVVAYEQGYVRIAAGPILGAFNSATTPIKAGISAGIRVDLPGAVFLSARAESSMGAGLIAEGDYAQELSQLEAGWYIYNAICSVSLLTRKFYYVDAPGSILADASNRYAFSVDMFRKGAPYKIKLDLGYQDLSRTYPAGTKETLGVAFIGAQVTADIADGLSLLASLESGVYAFGLDELAGKGPNPSAFLFRAGLGLRYTLGSRRATEPEAAGTSVQIDE